VNRVLGAKLGVRIVPADGVGVRLGSEWVQRFLYFSRLLQRIRDVPGDIAECGVAGGESLAMLASLVRASPPPRRLYGFDSWKGLPEPGEEDRASGRSVAAAQLFDWAGPENVRDELRRHGFADGEIERTVALVAGPFGETLPRFGGELALLHVDADLYASYRDALVHLWPRVVRGGVVALDEYELTELWPGPRRAVDEFLATLPSGEATLEEDESGKWFLVKGGS
jgi:Macrocin-O-methyltransferase (TylF)